MASPLLAAVSLAVSPHAVAASPPESGPVYMDAQRLANSCDGWLKNPCAREPPGPGISTGCLLGFFPFYPPAAELPCNPWITEPPVRVETPGLPPVPLPPS